MISKIVDSLVSVATLIIAGCAVWLVAGKAGLVEPPPTQGSAQPAPYEIGEAVSTIKGVDFTAAEKTVLVVIKSNCPYCTASSPFYRRLLEEKEARKASVQIVFAASQSDTQIADYLSQNELPNSSILRLQPGELKIRGTPTLLVVDKAGRVQSFWLGQLPEQQEKSMIEAVFREGQRVSGAS
jgi:thiol-disulfide isomerase/thioredoxin